MKKHWALFCYYLSLGWDNSEGEEAGDKEHVRLTKLSKAMGEDAFREWLISPKPNWLITLVLLLLNPLLWGLLAAGVMLCLGAQA